VRNRHFIDSWVYEYEGLYLKLRDEHINDERLHQFQLKNENLENFVYK